MSTDDAQTGAPLTVSQLGRIDTDGALTLRLSPTEETIKYGDNPTQTATAYELVAEGMDHPFDLRTFEPLLGTDRSYTNLGDLAIAIEMQALAQANFDVNGFPKAPTAMGYKHNLGCCAAYDPTDPYAATRKMVNGNLRDIFGGSVVLTYGVDEEIAEILRMEGWSATKSGRPYDVIAAPHFTKGARNRLARLDEKCRLLAHPGLGRMDETVLPKIPIIKHLPGINRIIILSPYDFVLNLRENITWYAPEDFDPEDHLQDLCFFRSVNAMTKSNAITIGKDHATWGNGAGCKSRIGAVEEAKRDIWRRGSPGSRLLMISDSFFPGLDALELAYRMGIRVVLGIAGGKNLQSVIDYCRSTENGKEPIALGLASLEKRTFLH